MKGKTIVVRISPRRWAKATLTDVIGGTPSYTVVRPIFDNSVDALSAVRAERKPAAARTAPAAPVAPTSPPASET